MAVGDVVDVDEIKSGVEKARHPSARGFDNDSSRGRRLDVARTNGSRWVDDDGRQRLFGDHRFHHLFGGNLALLVRADAGLKRERNAFIRHGSVVGTLQRGDAAGINNALDAGVQRLLHDDARAIHIGGENLARVGSPQPVIGGDVKDVTRARHGAAY
jgi:hypothetical protein